MYNPKQLVKMGLQVWPFTFSKAKLHWEVETAERAMSGMWDGWVADGGVKEKMNLVHLLVNFSSFVFWNEALSSAVWSALLPLDGSINS